MRPRFLGKNSVPGDSPTLYATDRDTYLVQGWKVTDPEILAKLDPLERDAFHVELKDAYATAIEDGPFAKWLKGEPDDYAWLQPWQTRIRKRHTGRQDCTPGQGRQ